MIFRIKRNDAEFEFISNACDFVHVLHGFRSQFADVREAVDFPDQLHEQTKRVDFENATLNGLSQFVFLPDAFPRILNKLCFIERNIFDPSMLMISARTWSPCFKTSRG